MNGFDYIVATDFDRAWLNFELDLPLKPEKNGKPNPFYIDRPGNPIAELTDALLAPFYRPPKFFFSGHRGCGKSTELLHLLSNPEIQKKYWPINFSIREEADIIDLDFRDVLLAIGSRLFREYRKKGGDLPEQLLKELYSWQGKIEKEVYHDFGRPKPCCGVGYIHQYFLHQCRTKDKTGTRDTSAIKTGSRNRYHWINRCHQPYCNYDLCQGASHPLDSYRRHG